jgi:hypothetical protein
MLQLGQYDMLKLSIFNAQGSRVVIVVVRVGAVKIYVAAVEALRKNERQDETQFYYQNWWFSEFHNPPIPLLFNTNILFCWFLFFFNLTLCMNKLRC